MEEQPKFRIRVTKASLQSVLLERYVPEGIKKELQAHQAMQRNIDSMKEELRQRMQHLLQSPAQFEQPFDRVYAAH